MPAWRARPACGLAHFEKLVWHEAIGPEAVDRLALRAIEADAQRRPPTAADPRVIELLGEVQRIAPWWWPLTDLCVLAEQALEWRFVAGGGTHDLHHPDGPAVQWRDGETVWAWAGVVVERRLIEHPETITLEEIERVGDRRLRGVLIERYGWLRYAAKTDAREIQRDDYGVLFHRRSQSSTEEALVFVRVVNSTPEPDGRFRTYYLRVPPWVRRAREAVAWTFQTPPEVYVPVVET